MEITFILPDSAAQLLRRLSSCIGEVTGQAPSCPDLVKTLIIELLIEDAQEHGVVDRPRLVS